MELKALSGELHLFNLLITELTGLTALLVYVAYSMSCLFVILRIKILVAIFLDRKVNHCFKLNLSLPDLTNTKPIVKKTMK